MSVDNRSLQEILNTRDAARYVGLSKSTLDKWRVQEVGPRWIVLGTYRVGYRVSDLEDWLKGQTRGSRPSPTPAMSEQEAA